MTTPTSINHFSEFNSRPVDTSVAYVLFWLVLNAPEPKGFKRNKTLKKYLATLTLDNATLQTLLNLARQQFEHDLLQVLDLLNRELNSEEKTFLLQMAVEVATFADTFSSSQNHILRFLADLLSIGEAQLAELYHRETQQKLPDSEDLSSPLWWFKTEKTQRSIDDIGTPYDRAAALGVLGLEETASADEIKRSYRRLVQLFHPDRHDGKGKAAAEAAEVKFLRVQRAYEVLKQ